MRNSPTTAASQANFAGILAMELAKSQRRKCRLASIMTLMALSAAGVVMVFGRAFFESLGDARGARFFFFTVPALLLVYEVVYSRALARGIRNGKPPSSAGRVLDILIEPTAISAWLFLEGLFFKPGAMFYSPVLYAYPMVVLLSSLHLSRRLCVLSGFTAAAQFMALALWQWPKLQAVAGDNAFAFLPVHGMHAFLILMSGVAAAFVAGEIRGGIERTLETLGERDHVVRIFGRYLTDEVVDDILNSPDGLLLGGKRRTVTLMITDLRGFSSLSESLAPESVIAMLNNYLAVMTDVIVRHRGTIDEFIGDAILAIFGAPFSAEDDAERAVACAVEMELAMAGVNRWNEANGLPRIEMGIGIHTGQVVVGNIGSEKRSKYGVVGSAVNLTSRIESYTVGGQILVSGDTAQKVGARLRAGERRMVHPKGIAQPIEIVDVRGIDGATPFELPERRDSLIAISKPLPVRFIVLEGKDMAGPTFDGQFAALSERSAMLRTSEPLQPLANLRLQLHGPDGEPIPGWLFAKITAATDSLYAIRFTAVDKDVEERIKAALT